MLDRYSILQNPKSKPCSFYEPIEHNSTSSSGMTCQNCGYGPTDHKRTKNKKKAK